MEGMSVKPKPYDSDLNKEKQQRHEGEKISQPLKLESLNITHLQSRNITSELSNDLSQIHELPQTLVWTAAIIANKFDVLDNAVKKIDPKALNIETFPIIIPTLTEIHTQLNRLLSSNADDSVKSVASSLLDFQFGVSSLIPFSLSEISHSTFSPDSIQALGEPILLFSDLCFFNKEIKNLKEKILTKASSTKLKPELHLMPLIISEKIVEKKESSSIKIPEPSNIEDKSLVSKESIRLQTAILNGDIISVDQCIKEGTDIEHVDCFGKTPIMMAALYGQLNIVLNLKSKGARIDKIDKSGRNILMLSILSGNIELVRMFAENFTDLYSHDEFGNNYLMCAASSGSKAVFDFLIEKGLKIEKNKETIVGENILNLAAKSGNLSVLEYLLESEFSIDTQSSIGTSALHSAVSNKQLETVKWLVQKGCNIQRYNKLGVTALMQASMNGYHEITEYLLQIGANPNAIDKNGIPALFDVANSNNIKMVKLLIKSGAKLSIEDNKGRNVVQYIHWNKQYAENKEPSETELYLIRKMRKEKVLKPVKFIQNLFKK